MALQESLSLANHWLSDAGVAVPESYAQILEALGERGDLDSDLAARLAGASGLRNLIAHRYGGIDSERIYEIASTRLDDLLALCTVLSRKAQE